MLEKLEKSRKNQIFQAIMLWMIHPIAYVVHLAYFKETQPIHSDAASYRAPDGGLHICKCFSG
jgi:hypothetical protein